MACMPLTTKQLETEYVSVFSDGDSTPTKLWVDHYHDYHTFIRAVFPKFTGRGADRMMDLRDRLMKKHGFKSAELSVVVFMNDDEWDYFAAHRLHIHLAR